MTEFPDHFSTLAAGYAASRPRYPVELFEWLAAEAPSRACAWDCGSGSGQAAIDLATRFDRVIASDASVAQLAHAPVAPNVHYVAMTAERSAVRSGTVSLITVAQALHWFRLPEFLKETKRALMPDGVLAVWSYGLLEIDPAIDGVLREMYHGELGPWWPAERALVDAGYESLDLQLPDLQPPPIIMKAHWNLDQVAAYLRTWSAVSRYQSATGRDAVTAFLSTVAPIWGDARMTHDIVWPLSVKVGRR